MNDIQILKKLLKSEVLIPLDDDCEIIKLEELGQYQISIKKMPSNSPSNSEAVIVKIDNFPAPDKLFKGTEKECKRADYAIIYNDGECKKFICFIELKAKSTTSSESDIVAQLKGGSCVISYIQSIGATFWNKSDFLKDYEYRYVSIRNISINKKITFSKNDDRVKHDKPENMLKINSPNNLYFRQLIGKK